MEQPTWYTLPDFLIQRFPQFREEIEEDYLSWSEAMGSPIGNPYPHFFLNDLLVPILTGTRTDADLHAREEAGRILELLLVADDDDLAAAAQTSVFEILRDNTELRTAAWPFLGAIARDWLARSDER
jgi:hypothetical protein